MWGVVRNGYGPNLDLLIISTNHVIKILGEVGAELKASFLGSLTLLTQWPSLHQDTTQQWITHCQFWHHIRVIMKKSIRKVTHKKTNLKLHSEFHSCVACLSHVKASKLKPKSKLKFLLFWVSPYFGPKSDRNLLQTHDLSLEIGEGAVRVPQRLLFDMTCLHPEYMFAEIQEFRDTTPKTRCTSKHVVVSPITLLKDYSNSTLNLISCCYPHSTLQVQRNRLIPTLASITTMYRHNDFLGTSRKRTSNVIFDHTKVLGSALPSCSIFVGRFSALWGRHMPTFNHFSLPDTLCLNGMWLSMFWAHSPISLLHIHANFLNVAPSFLPWNPRELMFSI